MHLQHLREVGGASERRKKKSLRSKQDSKMCRRSVTNRTFIVKTVVYSYFSMNVRNVTHFHVKRVFSGTERSLTGHKTPANDNRSWGGGQVWGGHTKFFFRKLMSPLVDES